MDPNDVLTANAAAKARQMKGDKGKEQQRQQQQHNNQKIVEDVVTYCSGDSVEEGCGKLWCRRQGNCHLGVMQQ